MNEIEYGFYPVSDKYLFGGDPHSEFKKKLDDLKSELAELDVKAFKEISFDIHELAKMKKSEKYDYKKEDPNHPRRIVAKLALVEKYITKNKLFELLDKIKKLDLELKIKVGEALKVIIPIYEKSLEIQTLAAKFLKLDPVIIPDPRTDTKSHQKKREKRVKKEIKKNDKFWIEIKSLLESDIVTVGETLKKIQQKV